MNKVFLIIPNKNLWKARSKTLNKCTRSTNFITIEIFKSSLDFFYYYYLCCIFITKYSLLIDYLIDIWQF